MLVAAVFGLGIALALYRRVQREEHLDFSVFNANRTYRVEFYSASGWQRLVHPGMRDPGFIRLHDNCKPGRLERQGPVVEFDGGSNGQVYWFEAVNGTVGVGRDTRFDNVPPLSPDCKVLPIPKR